MAEAAYCGSLPPDVVLLYHMRQHLKRESRSLLARRGWWSLFRDVDMERVQALIDAQEIILSLMKSRAIEQRS